MPASMSASVPASVPVPAPPPLSHAHHKPPPHIRAVHKTYQKLSLPALAQDTRILDFGGDTTRDMVLERHGPQLKIVGHVPAERAQRTFQAFRGAAAAGGDDAESIEVVGDVPIYEHESVPGLQLIPSLLPPCTQRTLLRTLLHTHLSNPSHLTNLHPHYNLPYPSSSISPANSFFALPHATSLPPRDPGTHKPLTAQRMLDRKLRWMTLGGQYDWTLKQYPTDGRQPPFPTDLAALISGLLPDVITPQAAITNLYSPGDMLAPHRDISESSRAALISISVGCDALFTISLPPSSPPTTTSEDPDANANATATPVLVLRVRSGDVLLMGGASRWAWHSVPRVLANTCPPSLQDFPGGELWEGWMAGKRVNLNVRQMWDTVSV